MSGQQAATRREFTRDLIFPREVKQLLVVTIKDGTAFWEIWSRTRSGERGKFETCGFTKPERIDAIAKDSGWTELKATLKDSERKGNT